MDSLFEVPQPSNEPVRTYLPGSDERRTLQAKVAEMAADKIELTVTIDGEQRMAGGERFPVVQPHKHAHVLGESAQASNADVADAVAAAKKAAPGWQALPYEERAAIFTRAADLLAGPWRDTINAATMLGQSKSVQQAEVDAACEFIDFLRFNAYFGAQLMTTQPRSVPGEWNRFDHRPLDGFVLAITPFNFTAIAGNLPSAPALMGNTVVWKPTPTQQLAAHHTMRLFEAAGLPEGVINLVTGDGQAVSEVALTDPDLGGVHFTGSTRTFQHLWRTVGNNIDRYRSYPRLIGETGGKDFVIVHKSWTDTAALNTALIRAAFEYQGQKCSAASRAYIPRSIWQGGLRDQLVASTAEVKFGDVADFTNFGGAVIDKRAYDKLAGAIELARTDDSCTIIAGGTVDDSEGFFVQPTVVECTDPTHEVFRTEYFGPFLAVYVYDDADFEQVTRQAADVSPYALTGGIFANDRRVITWASDVLRFSAGNFYVNDKPTGSIVSRQPFGGSRASGTNDKAGSWQNLVRWISPRAIKETFVAPGEWRYPNMG
ncbi:MAG: L-glutamate gamma-semialdehyde dehydrogenase [Actinocatenispora sp.]